jgi:hypothetical protein
MLFIICYTQYFCGRVDKIVNNIKEQNEEGQWYINYYLNDYGKEVPQYEPQNNNPEHNNDGNGQT